MGKYSYNDAVGKKAAERKIHAEGVFARLVTGAERFVKDDSDDLQIIVRSQALKDPSDPNSLVPGTEMGDFFTIPLDNPDVKGHRFLDGEWADMWAKSWAEFCAAIWPDEVPQKPLRREKKGDKLVGPYYFKDEEIDSEDYGACLQESVDAAGKKAEQVMEALDDEADLGVNGLGLVGVGYFAPIKNKKDKEGILRVNQVAYRAELPAFWELETKTFVVDQNAGKGGSSSSSRPSSSRTSKKKTSKKTTSGRKGRK